VSDPQAARVRANLEALIAEASKALTLEIAANLTTAAPVDTGHVRRNFVPSVGAPHGGEDEGAAQAAGQIAVLSYQIGDGNLFVTNNVPYLEQLLLGSSSQAAPGWDLIAVDAAVETVRQMFDVSIDVSARSVGDFGARAATGLASAYSPLGGDE
jgi:hypothetical protein